MALGADWRECDPFKWCRGYMVKKQKKVNGQTLRHLTRTWLVGDPDLWKAESHQFREDGGNFIIQGSSRAYKFTPVCLEDCSMEIPYGKGSVKYEPEKTNHNGAHYTTFNCYQKE